MNIVPAVYRSGSVTGIFISMQCWNMVGVSLFSVGPVRIASHKKLSNFYRRCRTCSPPYSNTGVVIQVRRKQTMNIMPNEVQKNGLRICADWISFTIPSWEGSTGALMAMSLLGYSHTAWLEIPADSVPPPPSLPIDTFPIPECEAASSRSKFSLFLCFSA
mgnify:CR=1 FL=1